MLTGKLNDQLEASENERWAEGMFCVHDKFCHKQGISMYACETLLSEP